MLYQDTGTLEAESALYSTRHPQLIDYYTIEQPVLGNPLISLVKLYASSLTMFSPTERKSGIRKIF